MLFQTNKIPEMEATTVRMMKMTIPPIEDIEETPLQRFVSQRQRSVSLSSPSTVTILQPFSPPTKQYRSANPGLIVRLEHFELGPAGNIYQ